MMRIQLGSEFVVTNAFDMLPCFHESLLHAKASERHLTEQGGSHHEALPLPHFPGLRTRLSRQTQYIATQGTHVKRRCTNRAPILPTRPRSFVQWSYTSKPIFCKHEHRTNSGTVTAHLTNDVQVERIGLTKSVPPGQPTVGLSWRYNRHV